MSTSAYATHPLTIQSKTLSQIIQACRDSSKPCILKHARKCRFDDDVTVVPRDSAWFYFFDGTQLLPANRTKLYQVGLPAQDTTILDY